MMFAFGRLGLLILGIGMLSGCSESPEEQTKREFKEYLARAEQGDAVGMGKVAYAYSMGNGTEKSITSAASWWEKCAALDDLGCKTSLAILYRDGDAGAGVPQDKVRARALFEEVVARGYGFEFNLADMYRKGEGGPVDYDKAAPLYRKTIADYNGDMSFGMVSESARFLTEMGKGR
jgi:TPR repeat protein